ncbi:MAG: hypothetical protein AAGG11_05455 [Pseudomonadota bacterium]
MSTFAGSPSALAAESARQPPADEPPAIQTTVIRPKQEPRCAEPGCDVLERLPVEQMERLRELDNAYPGQIIQFVPDTDYAGDRRR